MERISLPSVFGPCDNLKVNPKPARIPASKKAGTALPFGLNNISVVFCNAPRRNRTYNLVIKSHLLCQLS